MKTGTSAVRAMSVASDSRSRKPGNLSNEFDLDALRHRCPELGTTSGTYLKAPPYAWMRICAAAPSAKFRHTLNFAEPTWPWVLHAWEVGTPALQKKQCISCARGRAEEAAGLGKLTHHDIRHSSYARAAQGLCAPRHLIARIGGEDISFGGNNTFVEADCIAIACLSGKWFAYVSARIAPS